MHHGVVTANHSHRNGTPETSKTMWMISNLPHVIHHRREKAAKALQGIVSVAAIDADEHKELAGQFSIQGFPTIKLLGADAKGKVTALADYKGERTAAAIVEWAFSQAKKVALKRIGASSSSRGGRRVLVRACTRWLYQSNPSGRQQWRCTKRRRWWQWWWQR